MTKKCITSECEKYSLTYPTEDLGECSLDSIEEKTKHRRIITSTSICNHKPEYKNELYQILAEAGEHSNAGHPYS